MIQAQANEFGMLLPYMDPPWVGLPASPPIPALSYLPLPCSTFSALPNPPPPNRPSSPSLTWVLLAPVIGGGRPVYVCVLAYPPLKSVQMCFRMPLL